MGIRMSFKTLHAKEPCGLVLIFLLRTQLSETQTIQTTTLVFVLSFVVFISILYAESIIDTWNVPAKTKMESNKRREGMYNIIDFQLMGGLSVQ
jgi:hypothetical protein